MLDGAPVAAIDRVRADEVDRAGDPAAGPLGHDQHNAVAHRSADLREERAREVGAAPFARAGLHVEGEEGIPDAFGQFRAAKAMHFDAGRQRFLALAADRLALSRGEHGEEVIEGRKALVGPVELLVGTLKETAHTEGRPFPLGRECNVGARQAIAVGDLDEGIRQPAAHGQRRGAGAREEARPGHGGEGHRDLKLRVIVAAGPLIGFGPALVEHILAA